ncbi:MAG: hypothetical protein AAF193_12260, partial [Bacteroidota bacterium]
MVIEQSFSISEGQAVVDLSLDKPEVRYVLLGSRMAELLITPGNDYQIEFSKNGIHRGVVINRVPISLTCSEDNDANLVIEKFHRAYDVFLSEVFYDYALQQTSNSGFQELKFN